MLQHRNQPNEKCDSSSTVCTSPTVRSTASIWTKQTRSMWALSWSVAFVAVVMTLFTTFPIDSSSSKFSIPSPPSNDSVLSFLNWFHQEGGISHKITITTFPTMGRGILATGPINENDVVLIVPKHLIICHETILNHTRAIPGLVAKFQKLEKHSEELLTAFLLFQQLNTTTNGFWNPYLDILPDISTSSSIMSPLFYTDDNLIQELQDPWMIQAAKRERQQAKIAFQRFHRLFRSYLLSNLSSKELRMAYNWARFLIQSRAFSIQGQRYLVPYGDLFNNHFHPQVRTATNGNHFLHYHQLDTTQGITIRADRETLRGQHVWEDYGDNTNDIYFLYHGFLPVQNPFDCTMITFPLLTQQDKINVWKSLHETNGPSICITARGKTVSKQAEWILNQYTILWYMDPQEMKDCKQQYQTCFGHFRPSRQEQFNLILQGLESTLSTYPTTSAHDQDLLQHLSSQTSLAHVIRFRLHRKQAIEQAIQTLTTHLHGLDSQFKTNIETLEDSSSLDDRIKRFNTWVQQHLNQSLLTVQYIDQTLGYGVFTTQEIPKGKIYLNVPVSYVIDIDSAMDSPLIQHKKIRDLTDYQYLLVHLLHEKALLSSRWKPYLDILPDPQRLALTSLYYVESSPHMELLSYTDLYTLVLSYRLQMEQEYQILSKRFPYKRQDIQWAMTILDSRSIWWSGQRHLVPLLDMVNCLQLDPEQRVHSTLLERQQDHYVAVTRTSLRFEKGSQVIENYGQPNYIYLLYHGFVLSSNSHDCAHFHFDFQHFQNSSLRTNVITTLETWGFYTWTPDLCVIPSKLEPLIEMAALERRHEDPIQATFEAITNRLERLTKALTRFEWNDMYTNTMIWTYLHQQQHLLQQLEKRLKETY